MSILEHVLLRSGQRLDLEDWNLLLSALRTDSHFWTNRFLANTSYILQGFTVSQGFIGQPSAEIEMTDSTLINGDSTGDFSWFASQTAPDPLDIPAGSGGLQTGRNFIEVQLGTVDGTPLARAFWDPDANGGLGQEFTNTVDTARSLTFTVLINQSGFNTGDSDKISIAIIDLDGSGNIAGIQDKRDLFWRLGTTSDPQADYAWGSQEEPTISLSFTAPSVTPFAVGDVVTFSSGATAECVVGGTSTAEIILPSNINFNIGDTVTGTGGASAVLDTYYEAFTGADKDIRDLRDLVNALQTEVKTIKGTRFWFEAGLATSLPNLLKYMNALVAPTSADGGSRYEWSGTNLTITDDKAAGQATSDEIAAIRTMGTTQELTLTRQDGSGGSATLAIPDGSILFVELPTSGNRVFSENGSGSTNYQIVDRASFVESDANFILAYREGTVLIIRGVGELKPGESEEIGNQVSAETLAYIGADNDADSDPNYPSVAIVDQGDNLTVGIGKLDEHFDRTLERLALEFHESQTNKARILDATSSEIDNVKFTQEMTNLLMDFTGAVLNFTTGGVFEDDDTTPLGLNFQAITAIPDGEYIWYGIGLIPSSVSGTNRIQPQVQVTPAGASDANPLLAPYPDVAGTKKLGAILVQRSGSAAIVTDIERLVAGSGGGGTDSIRVDLYDPLSTALPTGTTADIDGVTLVDGDLVFFSNLSTGNFQIYEVSGVGVALAWTEKRLFANGALTPDDGESVRIQRGTLFADQAALYNGTDVRVNDTIRMFDGANGTDFWELSSIKTATLTDNTTDGEVFSVSATGSENWVVSYSVVRASGQKATGQLYLTTDGTTASVSDSNAYLADIGVIFNADIDTGNIRLLYTTTSTGSDATMKFFTSRWSDSPGGPSGVPNYPSAGSGTPAAGATGDIQFKSSGGNLDGDTQFKWDTTEKAINLNGQLSGALKGPVAVLDNQVTDVNLVTWADSYEFFVMEYSLTRDTDSQVGRIMITHNGVTTAISDDFVGTSGLGVTFSADLSGGLVRLRYTSTSTGFAGVFKYSLKRWS